MSDIYLLPIPGSAGELRALPVLVKPDWRGVTGRLMGAGLWLGERLNAVALASLVLALVGFFFAPIWAWLPLLVLAIVAATAKTFGLSAWCTSILDDWVQVVGGRVMLQRGRDPKRNPPSLSLLGHEAVHDWQMRRFGWWRYNLGYALSRNKRRHYEAMAYGYQVAEWGRHPENAATSAAEPIYGMKWTRAEARELIEAYAEAFNVLWRLDAD